MINMKNQYERQPAPEEPFAALTGHRVKVEAGGLVATHPADPRGIAVELIRPDH